MKSRFKSIGPLAIFAGTGGPDSLQGGAGDDQLFGFGGDDTLRGAGGNDWLEPGSGDDLVDGGAGTNDLVSYAEGTDDIAITRGLELDLAAGTAIDGWNATDTLLGIEDAIGTMRPDRMAGDAANNAFAGRAGNDTLIGAGGHDWLRPGSGNDSVDGGAGYDTVSYEDDPDNPGATQGVRVDLAKGTAIDGFDHSDTLVGIEAVTGGSRADRIIGNAQGNDLQGNAGNDTLLGAGGEDFLKPGRGNDSINGGTGTDTLSYVRVWSDPVALHGATVDLDAGTALDPWDGSDSVAGIEIVLGSALADFMRASDNGGSTLEGRVGNDTLVGGTADDWLQPGRGVDSVDGGADHDWLSYVEDAGESAPSQGVTVNLQTGVAIDGWGARDTLLALENVAGTMLNDRLTGLGHHSRLEGRGGNDTLVGGELVYERDPGGVFVNLGSTAVTRNQVTVAARRAIDGKGGTDVLGAGVVSGYGSHHDDVWFSDDHDAFVIARGGDDFIRTGSGYDWLQPGPGNDTVNGGANADGVSYRDDGYEGSAPTQGVTVNLATGVATDGWGGTDQLIGIEDVYGSKLADRLTGKAGSNYLEGGEGNDTLSGQDGDDVIVGGEGNDLVYGGAGNDFYGLIGSSRADYSVTENPDGSLTVVDNNPVDGDDGTDTLHGIEFVGLARIGTDDDDRIVSNSGEAILALGGDGDDVYVVTQADHHVLELAGEGDDTIEAAVSHVLEPNVENLVLTGTADLDGTGNEADNLLEGNAGSNALDGGAGADTMRGGDGDDTYYVDETGDDAIETAATALPQPGEPHAGTNIDTVISQVSYTLRVNIENLQLQGTGDLVGSGNSLNNILYGNAGDNVLRGLGGTDLIGAAGGRDTLDGGEGNDTLRGGADADAFVFRVAPTATGNRDTLLDFVPGVDQLRLDDDAFTAFDAGVTKALAPGQFRAAGGSVAQDATDRIIYNTTSGALFYDPDGTGDAPALKFAQLSPNLALTATDFMIVG